MLPTISLCFSPGFFKSRGKNKNISADIGCILRQYGRPYRGLEQSVSFSRKVYKYSHTYTHYLATYDYEILLLLADLSNVVT